MRRRDFLLTALLVGSSPAVPQQPPVHARVGWLARGDEMPRRFFEETLARLGWVEGKNLTIERRFAGSDVDRQNSTDSESPSTTATVLRCADDLPRPCAQIATPCDRKTAGRDSH